MISCYLDSQDYSALTDAKTLTAEQEEIRTKLLVFSREGKVQFVYSEAIIAEAVALTPEAARLAERKAEFLSELCGRNALVSFDRLRDAEVEALACRRDPPRSMLDPDGNWFPALSSADQAEEPPWRRLYQMAQEDIGTEGLNRAQRRKVEKKLFRKGGFRNSTKAQFQNQNTGALIEPFIQQYPMKPEHAKAMASYCLGRATERDFTNALADSLRDPSWMMKWFSTDHSILSPIAEMVRTPGRELGLLFRKLAELAVQRAEFIKEINLDSNPTNPRGEVFRLWNDMQNGHLMNLVQSTAGARGLCLDGITPELVDVHCPGISATIRSLCSSVWENVVGARKEAPSDSQPVDSLHAMFAPYVQVFRADRFMTPHIQKQVCRYGTTVVPRLTQLVKTLEEEIRKREQP